MQAAIALPSVYIVLTRMVFADPVRAAISVVAINIIVHAITFAALYGLTPEQYDLLSAKQGGVCAICHQPETARTRDGKYRLRVDHDYKTGKVRGLLCHKCNAALGHLEKEEWRQSAMKYLSATS